MLAFMELSPTIFEKNVEFVVYCAFFGSTTARHKFIFYSRGMSNLQAEIQFTKFYILVASSPLHLIQVSLFRSRRFIVRLLNFLTIEINSPPFTLYVA